ncbi:MAG TPA: hypothetical protein VGF78_04465 [Candidatus Dormibacteraeota bacterium]|jgi:hypothetical protein
MINFAGLGEAIGNGEACGVGDSAGVGAVLGVEIADGDASGEAGACAFGCVHPAKTKTSPAIHAAGTTPLLIRV